MRLGIAEMKTNFHLSLHSTFTIFAERYVMRRNIVIILVLSVMAAGCSDYYRLQKSTDPDEKYAAAKNYFQEKKYLRCSTLLEDIISYYRNTPQAEEMLYLLSESYIGQKDYYSASEYYQAYLRNYPRGEYAEEARFRVGYCYYWNSPDARLDQTATKKAIAAFTEYLSLYPTSDRADEARRYMEEMTDKLAYKGYLNAKLYYNLGLYGGNNYRASVITAENTLKEYPDTKYKDDLYFIILQSKYKEASLSVDSKRRERYSEVIDEYYRYANEFSDGKHIREANRILKEAKKLF